MRAIVLAAGQGKRMYSKTSKVLHQLMGKPMLRYVAEACQGAGVAEITVVTSPADGAAIKEALEKGLEKGQEKGFHFAVQETAQGTGHAVMAAAPFFADGDDVLVLCGDMPLITARFLQSLADFYRATNADGVVTAIRLPGATDFGRVYAGAGGDIFDKIVEQKDLAPDAPPSALANVGAYLFKGAALRHGLARIDNQNSQREYYLTDVPKALRDDGWNVRIFHAEEPAAVFTGINNQAQLADAAQYLRRQINQRHLQNGVQMADPTTAYIDDMVEIAAGAFLYPGVLLEGRCAIAEGAVIGPNARLKNTVIGAHTVVQYSVLTDATVGAHTEIGPFAYLRMGAEVGDHCRVGDFVEVKNAKLGSHTKAAHLAYMGDADIGSGVNYSCGAITGNYDGKRKHRTVIKDNAFIGCNTNLVAPVTVGEGAFVAAGSTITEEVPAGAFAIARARQVNKTGWTKPD